jgi:hypothetical protein
MVQRDTALLADIQGSRLIEFLKRTGQGDCLPTEGRKMGPLIRRIMYLGLLITCSFTSAQSVPAGEGGRQALSLWLGAEASTFNADWGCASLKAYSCWDQLQGLATFSDVMYGRVGMEGEGRWLIWLQYGGVKQTNYLVGPRFQALGGERYAVDLKFLAGGATLHTQSQWSGWGAIAPGITGEFKVSPRFIVRADYEYQIWPGIAGSHGQHGLTPNGFSVGVSYRVKHKPGLQGVIQQ